MTRLAFILALLFTAPWQETETVDVTDRGPVDLKAFTCQDVTRSSIIARVCYDDAKPVHARPAQRQPTDHYCELPKAARDALLNAPSMGQYFNVNIKATGSDENGPYDCRTHKVPSYQ